MVLTGVKRQPRSAVRKRQHGRRGGGGGGGGDEGGGGKRVSSCWLSHPDGGLRYFLQVCGDSHRGEVLLCEAKRARGWTCLFVAAAAALLCARKRRLNPENKTAEAAASPSLPGILDVPRCVVNRGGRSS